MPYKTLVSLRNIAGILVLALLVVGAGGIGGLTLVPLALGLFDLFLILAIVVDIMAVRNGIRPARSILGKIMLGIVIAIAIYNVFIFFRIFVFGIL